MLLRSLKGLISGKYLGKKVPLKVQHIITLKCNFRCKYCGLWKEKVDELDTEQVKEIIRVLRKKGAVSWTLAGGEPLLRTDLKEIVEYLKENDILVNITTNGSLVGQNIDWMDRFDMVSVSLDGPKKIQEQTRGPGSYDHAINAINMLKKRGINTAVSAVLTKELLADECNQLKEYLKLIAEMGLKAVFLPVYKDDFNWSKDMEDITPDQNAYNMGLDILEDFKNKHHGMLLMSKPTFRWLRRFYEDVPMKCWAGRMFLTVYPDGSMASCMFKQDTRIYDGTIEEKLKNLKTYPNCPCKTNCYFEYNNMISMKPQTLKDLITELYSQKIKK